MKCFEVAGSVTTGFPIQTSDDGFRYVGVGESGRGRRLTKVPVGRDIPTSVEHIDVVGIQPAASGRTVVLVSPRPNDRRALVLFRDRSGFRGGCSFIAGVLPPPEWQEPSWQTPIEEREAFRQWREERRKMVEGRTLAAPASISSGPVWFSAGAGRVAVVAEGACAQGDAGRMGGGPELLVIMEPGAAVTVHRTGRLYGNPDRLIVSWEGETLTQKSWSEYGVRLDEANSQAEAW